MSCNHFTKCQACRLYFVWFNFEIWIQMPGVTVLDQYVNWIAPQVPDTTQETRSWRHEFSARSSRDVVNRSFVLSRQHDLPTYWLRPVWQSVSGGAQRPCWSSANWSQWKRLTLRQQQVASLTHTHASCCDLHFNPPHGEKNTPLVGLFSIYYRETMARWPHWNWEWLRGTFTLLFHHFAVNVWV